MIYYYYLTKNNKKLHILLVDEHDENITLGYVYLNRVLDNVWEVKSIASEKGLGYKMYDAAMDLIYPHYIIPNRDTQIKSNISSIYNFYINKRKDVESKLLNKSGVLYVKNEKFDDNWYNRIYKLKKPIGIDFEMDKQDIKYEGIRYFNSKYDFRKEDAI
ncbi:MAG: hypothetical protein WDA02_10470 [Saccharofermentanales bacterium]|jgi:hypothetical protein